MKSKDLWFGRLGFAMNFWDGISGKTGEHIYRKAMLAFMRREVYRYLDGHANRKTHTVYVNLTAGQIPIIAAD